MPIAAVKLATVPDRRYRFHWHDSQVVPLRIASIEQALARFRSTGHDRLLALAIARIHPDLLIVRR
jgi:hypothetical protein